MQIDRTEVLHLFRRLRRRADGRGLRPGRAAASSCRACCLPARSACRAGSSSFRRGRRVKAFLNEFPECARHHRARRQVRPAAQRRHPADRHRSAGAGQDRIPPDRRSPADRLVDSRSGDAHERNHAVPGGRLLRHRHPDPAAGRRQSLGSARQSVARAARPQEDEGQGSGAVDGSQGLGRHHRRAALHRRPPRLPEQPRPTSCRCSPRAPAI